jgi:acetyl-CoA carboxylase biotin carboxyl carrier protein
MKPTRKKTENPAASGGRIDWTEVNQVLDFMSQHNLEEFEYASGDLRVHLRKPGTGRAGMPVMGAPPIAPATQAAGAGTPAAVPPPVASEAAPEEGFHHVKSPIVGTFYSSPNPNAPPFVKVGDKVSAGQVLCIVEAMKLMNEIESDVAGELVRVLVENGQPVEYGQPLFAIRPARS